MNENNNTPKLFVILAYRRTGSNYLMKVLDSFSDIEFFGEVYHWDTVWMPIPRKKEYVKWLKNQHDISLTVGDKPHEDRELVEFNHEKPDYFLKFFNKSKSKFAGFKLFPEHLHWPKLKEHILSNKSVSKIILERNLLDVYISDRILQQTQKSQEYNTSSIKINIDCLDFKHWYYSTKEYYSRIELFLKNDDQKYFRLFYEDIHSNNTDEDKIQYIHSWLADNGFEVAHDRNNSEYTKKQDKRNRSLQKVENSKELADFLHLNNLAHLIHD